MPGVCGKFVVPNRIESFRIDLIHRDAFVGVRDLVGRCVHWDISNKTVISVGVSNTNTLKGGGNWSGLTGLLVHSRGPSRNPGPKPRLHPALLGIYRCIEEPPKEHSGSGFQIATGSA